MGQGRGRRQFCGSFILNTYRVSRLFRDAILGVNDPVNPINSSELQ